MRLVVFLEEARREALAAFFRYEAKRRGLGVRFSIAISGAIAEILDRPFLPPVIRRDMRRVLVKRFPFMVFYRAYPETIVIVGVIHGRRHPQTWLKR